MNMKNLLTGGLVLMTLGGASLLGWIGWGGPPSTGTRLYDLGAIGVGIVLVVISVIKNRASKQDN